MSFSPFRAIGQGIKLFWSAVNSSRRFFVNAIFLLFVIFLLISIFSSSKVKVEDKTILMLNFKGDLVEQHAGSTSDAFLAEIQGDSKRSTQLRDILAVLDNASKDSKISYRYLGNLSDSELKSLREDLALRKKYQGLLKEVRQNMKRIKGIVRGRKRTV